MVTQMRLAAALPVLLLLGFCSTTDVTGSLCPIGPFIGDPGASNRLTRSEKEYVVTLNSTGEKLCGWTAPS